MDKKAAAARHASDPEEEKQSLNVKISKILMTRVNAVIGASGKTKEEWMSELLETRTIEYEPGIDKIRQREKEIEAENQAKLKKYATKPSSGVSNAKD